MLKDADVEFMLEAYRYAEKHATDPSTQNGAVLVAFRPSPLLGTRSYLDYSNVQGRIVAEGANCFPRGVKDLPERWARPAKYMRVEHAERNCIYAAARDGVATLGLIMYAPWIACSDCARAIIQSGISEVIGHKPCPDSIQHIENPNGSWDDSIAVGISMLEEAGVKVRYLEGKLDPTDSISIRRNGHIYHP